MFSKILIANRGEIACRIVKTAHRLGIKTVAVYSDADTNARHVRLATEAIHIGPAAARDSYLSIDKIIAAAKATGAQAIHPGYGFLSENETFAAACAANNIVFIGPPIAAIRSMGSKSEAKKLMAQAGVPLTPGYHGDNQEPEFLRQQADAIGYPVLIKAAAGGGGKGMRVVNSSGEFLDALASCQREALSSFGDEHVLIEKYLLRPRHIEMQIFGDSQGNIVHLFERDCSVQRRHQKVLEEAPAPGMTPERRAAMGQAAVNAAKAVGYVGAGTVEFIVPHGGEAFYFMEMNTRLQVEHPVTEMITGVDLVEWQLRIAAGEPLPLAQEQLRIKGHAIEARIYAEDADKGFLPSIGRLIHLTPPTESPHVRVDTGVEQGDEITPYYDPMIAKLIVWDADREQARLRLRQALADYRIAGVTNNISFLSRLVDCPPFAQGEVNTGLIEHEHSMLFPAISEPPHAAWLSAALAHLLHERERADTAARASEEPGSPWHSVEGWRLNAVQQRAVLLRFGEIEKSITANLAQATYLSDSLYQIDLEGRRITPTVIIADAKCYVFLEGQSFVFAVINRLAHADGGSHAEASLIAPMPGKIIALLAAVDALVEKGAPLLILEAMKMEHAILAPTAGTVRRFCYSVGEQVKDGAELVEFEPVPQPK